MRIIKSEKLADRWELTAETDTLVRVSFNGPAHEGVGPVFMSVEQPDGQWTEPIKVVDPERFAMRGTENTAVRPAFNTSWVHNFCRAMLNWTPTDRED